MLVTIVVLDSVGMGELADAANFGDAGAHTINNIMAHSPTPLPNLSGLGMGRLKGVNTSDTTISSTAKVAGGFGRMREVSPGKDTSTGHWEFMGVQLEHPFQIFPDGFPPEVMDQFDAATGRGHLCNKPYSGTEVIKDFGEEHVKTGNPIVYTSGDSVFQIAAHEDVVPLEQLYGWCQAARDILQGKYAVARVIARPFKGEFPFERVNEHRKDYSLEPPRTVLNAVKETGKSVVGIGKIPDIFAHQGFTEEIHTDNNMDGVQKTIARMKPAAQNGESGLIFTNLVDFDAKFGHRRDPAGYARSLAEFDQVLPDLLAAVPKDGLLLIISDHGNDPTWHGTDHTREHGLLLAYRPGVGEIDLGDRETFADVGATVADALGATWEGPGESFWKHLS